jgi:anti-sigma B factor antagonist
VIRSSPFGIHSELNGEQARLTLTGELDIATVQRLEEAVESVLSRDARTIIIDLGGLAFMDSSGLRLFITLHERAGTEGWALGLTRPPESCFSVFQITGADQNLPFIEGPSP